MNEQDLVRRALGRVDVNYARQELEREQAAWLIDWEADMKTRSEVYTQSIADSAGWLSPDDYAYLQRVWDHTQECLAAGDITRGDEFNQMMKDTAPATDDWIKPLMSPFHDEGRADRFRRLVIACGMVTD